MPFVNVQIIKGRSAETKAKISQGIVKSITDNTEIAEDAIWVVFEEVEKEDWFVGRRSVKELHAKK
jgi:4-oxalocrotonate tautomerase